LSAVMKHTLVSEKK